MEQFKTSDKRRLGRGLSALIPPTAKVPVIAEPLPERLEEAPAFMRETELPARPTSPENLGIQELPISKITPNLFQPRMQFDAKALDELVSSITVHGILQPVMVRPRGGDRYELVAGERRFRAAQMAGLKKVPVTIRDMTDEESLVVALIENIQREDLNGIEAARGYRQLLDQFNLTQSELARQIGKAQPTIANALRLLKLSPRIQDSIAEGQISEEHGKALLTIPDDYQRETLWKAVIDSKLSVLETRKWAQEAVRGGELNLPKGRRSSPVLSRDVHWQALEDRLRSAIGLKVSIKPTGNDKGTVTIDFSSPEDIEGLLEKLHAF